MAANAATEGEAREILTRTNTLIRTYKSKYKIGIPSSIADQALEVDDNYRIRPHLKLLSDRIVDAVHDVEQGRNRMVAVSMPPRSGKSTLLSKYGPLWLLRLHPDWDIVTSSHDGSLVEEWAKADRDLIEGNPGLGIRLARDGGAGGHWSTMEGGSLRAVSVRGPLTGRGAKVLIIDDPIKDFVDAHSATIRKALWDWWRSVAFNRLEPPYLVIVVMTRWHEDDFVGRLFNPEMEGDPEKWERISLPAVAEEPGEGRPPDALGRSTGEPLLSPIIEEDRSQALDRLADTRRAVGTYVFNAMYQQRPAPAKGAIFDSGWWRFWTMNRANVTEDGRVRYLDPSSLTGGRWLDSWDSNFDAPEGSSSGSWVVGQRWVLQGPDRFLIAQQRGRWTFTQTISRMMVWARQVDPVNSPCGHLVHERLVEKKANGAAIIDVLKTKISGIKPITPTASKEARARSVTPECESGNVLIPYPGDPGNEWVQDWLSEVRNFPFDTTDDQVDAMTQALAVLRGAGSGTVTVPSSRRRIPRDIARAAATDNRRSKPYR